MSFREKSAWGMVLLLGLTGGLFFKLTLLDGVPAMFAAIPFVLFTVVGAMISQVAIAVFSLKDANSPADERERLIADKAGHLSSYVLGVAVLFGLGLFMLNQDGQMLFMVVLSGLIIGQISEYAIQLTLFRRWA